MATQTLFLHWKAVRLGLIPLMIAAFGVPLLAVQGMGIEGSLTNPRSAAEALDVMEVFLGMFPVLAAAIGFTLGLSAWNWDHKHGHVYALSLPVARWEHTMLKFGAGVVLALLPVGALLLGSLVATAAVDLPVGLNAYPMRVTMRFLFSILLLYSMVFALASGTIRTTVIVLSTLIGAPIVLTYTFHFLGGFYPWMEQIDVAESIVNALLEFGPFRVLTGNWMLIDV